MFSQFKDKLNRKVSAWQILLTLVIILASITVMAARYEVLTVTKLKVATIEQLTTSTGLTLNGTGVITATNIADTTRHIQLPIGAFVFDGGLPVTDSTAPGYEEDDLIPNIVWADGETTPVFQSFRVPYDYASGGTFKVLATESDSTTPNEIDFLVYVNADGAAADSAATGQTPVALAGTESTPDEVSLTVAADFASLAAGKWVTLSIWRDNTATGTGDLEVKGAAFEYTAKQ
jgi:hypothetical protein